MSGNEHLQISSPPIQGNHVSFHYFLALLQVKYNQELLADLFEVAKEHNLMEEVSCAACL